jgi:hypothetical protein
MERTGRNFNLNVACTAQDVKYNLSNQLSKHQKVLEKLAT